MSDSDEDFTPVEVDIHKSAAAFRAENAKVSRVPVDETPEQRAQREEEERITAEVWADINRVRQQKQASRGAPRARPVRSQGTSPTQTAAQPTEKQLEARRKREEEAAKFRAAREAQKREAMARPAKPFDEIEILGASDAGSEPAVEVSIAASKPAATLVVAPPAAETVNVESAISDDLDFLDDIEEDVVALPSPAAVTPTATPAPTAPTTTTTTPMATLAATTTVTPPTGRLATLISQNDGVDWKALYETERVTNQKLSDLLKEYDATMTQMVAGNDSASSKEVERLTALVAELHSQAAARDVEHQSKLEAVQQQLAAAEKAHRQQLQQLEAQAAASAAAAAQLEAERAALHSRLAGQEDAERALRKQHADELAALTAKHRAELDAKAAEFQAQQQQQQASSSPSSAPSPAAAQQLRVWQLKCSRLAAANTALEATKQALEAANRELTMICDELLVVCGEK